VTAWLVAASLLAQAAAVRDPQSALRAGQYEAAIAAYQRDAKARPQDFVVWSGLAQALAEVGRYAEAEEAARDYAAKNPGSPELLATLGELLLQRGRSAEAEQAFKGAIAGRARDAFSAEAALATLRFEHGRREEARLGFERLIAAYNGGRARTAADLIAVGKACRLLGQDNPQAFKDAL
jgi:Flp pilus assembly protein TadD